MTQRKSRWIVVFRLWLLWANFAACNLGTPGMFCAGFKFEVARVAPRAAREHLR